MSANRRGSSHQSSQDREASLRRVAIVLNSIPAPLAAKLLSSFDQDKRSRLRKTMTGLSDVDPLERKRALESFSGSIHQGVNDQTNGSRGAGFVEQKGMAPSSDEFVTHSGTNGTINAATSTNGQDVESYNHDESHPLSFLVRVPNPQVTNVLGQEHPQTVAVVLASIPPDNAAQILPGLPRAIRDDVIRRIGRMTRVEPDMLSDVADLLKAKCMDIDLPRDTEPGSNALRAIMAKMQVPESTPSTGDQRTSQSPNASGGHTPGNSLSQSLVDDAMTDDAAPSRATGIENASSDRADLETQSSGRHVRSLSTDDINSQLQALSPTDLCFALGRVSAREALLTLCGLPMKQANRAIAMLPKAQQKRTREQLANLGQLQLADIDRAKERVAHAAMEPATDMSTGGATASNLAAA